VQNGPTSWTQLERLVEMENKRSRSARTQRILNNFQSEKKQWVEKTEIEGKKRYLITNAGEKEFERRHSYSLLAASAPFYFKKGLPLISFGEELTAEEQKKADKLFKELKSNHPKLRCISFSDDIGAL